MTLGITILHIKGLVLRQAFLRACREHRPAVQFHRDAHHTPTAARSLSEDRLEPEPKRAHCAGATSAMLNLDTVGSLFSSTVTTPSLDAQLLDGSQSELLRVERLLETIRSLTGR